MTVGIYCIEHIDSSKKYVGKSVSVEARLAYHKCALTRAVRGKDVNRYLYAAVKKHGIDRFKFRVLESLDNDFTEDELADRELYWILHYKTIDRDFGYNLRLDSSSQSIVHEETKKLLSETNSGKNNPNFGNKWSDAQKKRMSDIQIARWANGVYGESFKEKHLAASRTNAARLKADTNKLEALSRKIKDIKQKVNKFAQYSMEGILIRVWDSKEAIISAYPDYKWQNIYAACNGNKPSYMKYLWRMLPKLDTAPVSITPPSPYTTEAFHVKKAVQKSKAGIPTIDEAVSRISNKGLHHLIPAVVEEYNKRYGTVSLDNQPKLV